MLTQEELKRATPAYVSIRQHTSAYVRIRLHTSAYISIRQHTSAYVEHLRHVDAGGVKERHTAPGIAHVVVRKIALQKGRMTRDGISVLSAIY
jgi:hypothetical protein